MRRSLIALIAVLAVATLVVAAVAVHGSRPRQALAVAEADELLGIGATSTPTSDPGRLRVVVADLDLAARIGTDATRLGSEHGLREDVDAITTALEHFDADVIVLFDVPESLTAMSRPMVRRVAADTGLRFMLQTRHWSKRRAWWPTHPVFTPVGPVDAAHVIYARWPVERLGGAVRAPRGHGLAHRLWGPWQAWMSGRVAIGPTRAVQVSVDAGLASPLVADGGLHLRACLGPCAAVDGHTTLTSDDAHVGLAFGPGFELLRSVTHGRMHGTLVHQIIYAELAINAPAPPRTPAPQ